MRLTGRIIRFMSRAIVFFTFFVGILMIISAGLFLPDFIDHGRNELIVQGIGTVIVFISALFAIVVMDIRNGLV